MDIPAILEDTLNATFVRTSNGEQVWELADMKWAKGALTAIEQARPFNWCPVQQPKGPVGRKPQIVISN